MQQDRLPIQVSGASRGPTHHPHSRSRRAAFGCLPLLALQVLAPDVSSGEPALAKVPAGVGPPSPAVDRLATMRDTKQSKNIGEHHVAAEMARRGWALALTRDGLERTDILAVLTTDEKRVLVEVQVKTARGSKMESISWPLGEKSQAPSAHTSESSS